MSSSRRLFLADYIPCLNLILETKPNMELFLSGSISLRRKTEEREDRTEHVFCVEVERGVSECTVSLKMSSRPIGLLADYFPRHVSPVICPGCVKGLGLLLLFGGGETESVILTRRHRFTVHQPKL